jgi:hypothetical protein
VNIKRNCRDVGAGVQDCNTTWSCNIDANDLEEETASQKMKALCSFETLVSTHCVATQKTDTDTIAARTSHLMYEG